VFAVALVLILRGFPTEDTRALPCRPTIACTADIVAPGIVEIEAGGQLKRAPDATTVSTPLLLKLTLADWGQLQVGSGGLLYRSGFSFDAVSAGLKLHVQDQTDLAPSVSFSLAVGFPTAQQSQGSAALLALYLTKDFGWLHADFNIGLNLLRPERDGHPQAWSALALSVALPHGFGPMAELYGFSNAAPLAARDAGVLLALAWQPAHWLVIDAGVDIALIEATRQVNAFVGFTVTAFDFWDSSEETRLRLLRETQHER
jgi:hypothetical protein